MRIRLFVPVLMVLAMLVQLPFVEVGADKGDPFDSTTLYLNEGPALERKASDDKPLTINKFGDWENIDGKGLHGEFDQEMNVSLDLVIINDAMLEASLVIEVLLDQDGNGDFEVILGFPGVFLPASTGSSTKRIETGPVSMDGNWSDMENGTVRFRIRQERPYRDNIKLRMSENDLMIIPYHQKVPYADAGPDLHGFDGKEIRFNGNGSVDPNGDQLTYQWDFNSSDGLQVDAEGIETTHVYEIPGTYNVTLMVSDGEFNDTDVVVVVVEERLPPVARAGSNITVDRREQFTLDGSGSRDPNGDELTFEWDIMGATVSGVRVNHSFEESGAYNITLTVSDGTFEDSDNVTVFVNPNRAPVAVLRRETEEALGIPVTFNGSGSHDPDGDGVKNYLWDFGDGGSAEGAVVEHTFLVSGKVNVTLTVSDGLASGSATLIVEIPENKVPSGKIKVAQYIFDNRSYSFIAEEVMDPEEMDVDVFWDMGDGTLLEGPLVNHTYRTSGMHRITMELVDELGGSREVFKEIEVLDSKIYLPESVEVKGNFSASHGVQQGYYHEVWETTWVGGWPRLTIKLIPEGGARYYKLNLSEGVYNISVKVTDGGNIDVLLMDKANRDEYAAYNIGGEQRYIDWEQYGSDLNTGSMKFQFTSGKIMFLVIGNNGKMQGGAEP
ncbi:MAG: PKD domain-containing protein, partial [Thermoplasmatota archaeon]